jgi:hypothetical protein
MLSEGEEINSSHLAFAFLWVLDISYQNEETS